MGNRGEGGGGQVANDLVKRCVNWERLFKNEGYWRGQGEGMEGGAGGVILISTKSNEFINSRGQRSVVLTCDTK